MGEVLECLVGSIGREVLVSYGEYIAPMPVYRSALDAELAPVEVIVKYFNRWPREYGVALLERGGRLYPVIKPGTPYWSGVLRRVPWGFKRFLEVHTHVGFGYALSSGDVRRLLRMRRKPRFYGVLALAGEDVVRAVLVEWRRGLRASLERAEGELREVERRYGRARLIGYIPMLVPCGEWLSRLAGDDKELVRRCVKMINEAYAAARESLEALGRAFRLALEQAKSLIIELRPEDVVDVMPMPILPT